MNAFLHIFMFIFTKIEKSNKNIKMSQLMFRITFCVLKYKLEEKENGIDYYYIIISNNNNKIIKQKCPT